MRDENSQTFIDNFLLIQKLYEHVSICIERFFFSYFTKYQQDTMQNGRGYSFYIKVCFFSSKAYAGLSQLDQMRTVCVDKILSDSFFLKVNDKIL